MFPVHGKGDAIGKHRGERGLDCRLDPIRQYSLVRHPVLSAQFVPPKRYSRPSTTILAVQRTSLARRRA
jgi:hypothetical protein